MNNLHLQYILSLADNTLILSQRLGEWCGHGPVLEQDIALTNIALDLLGQARMLYEYAGGIEGKGRSDDDFAYFRDAHQFYNVMLVEQANQDWAYTIARQFFFDVYHFQHWQEVVKSTDKRLAEIGGKALKEVTYHLRFSSEWMLRLGDGTPISKEKIQTAVDDLWMFTGELYTPNAADQWAAESGIAPDFNLLKQAWDQKTAAILAEATLTLPTNTWMQLGGKDGKHTEQLGFILAEMQHLQRTYPGQKW
jgi:ring-1,2-phenylacetyl-CoA epoxidase subunit PaaC